MPNLPPWGLKEVFSAFFLGFVLVSLSISIMFSSVLTDITSFSRVMISHIASYLVWLIIIITLIRRYRHDAFYYLGLKKEKTWWSYIFDGFFCGGTILMIGWGMGYLAQKYHWAYQQPLDVFTGDQLRYIALLAIITAPFLEEIAFRGFLQAALYRYMKIGPAIVFTALLFTSFHSLYFGYPLALVYVFLMGLVLGIFRYVSRSIIPSIIGHLINNIMAAIVLLSGQTGHYQA